MYLTLKEEIICEEYRKKDAKGKRHCYECPLALADEGYYCYRDVDERTKEAKKLRRY